MKRTEVVEMSQATIRDSATRCACRSDLVALDEAAAYCLDAVEPALGSHARPYAYTIWSTAFRSAQS